MNFIDEVDKAAKFYADTHTEWFDSEGQPHVAPAFEAGAKWADKTMIKKACEWLAPVFRDLAGYYNGAELLDDFKKQWRNK